MTKQTGSKPSRQLEDAVRYLDAWIEALLDYERLPGAAVAAVHRQRIVHARGYGFADVAREVAVTPQTSFRIASISKVFTAVAVMQLRDEGKLRLDDAVSDHLTWFDPVLLGDRPEPPTIRDLLCHTSGLPCEPDRAIWRDRDRMWPDRDELVRRAARITQDYPTRVRLHYSNLGYALLGEIVSTLSGLTYDAWVRERIAEPVGMHATAIGTPIHGEVATGYSTWPRSGMRRPTQDSEGLSRAMAPAVGFSSTLADLAALAAWQLRALDGKDADVLRPETLREMHSSAWENPEWGLGFAAWGMNGRRFVGHQGGCSGFSSFFILCPESETAVIVLCNGHDAPVFTLAFGTHEILLSSLLEPHDGDDELVPGSQFVGFYADESAWSDALVAVYEGTLGVLWVKEGLGNPTAALVRLAHVEGGTFRQQEGDGALGKHYVFEASETGGASLRFNNNILTRQAPRPIRPGQT